MESISKNRDSDRYGIQQKKMWRKAYCALLALFLVFSFLDISSPSKTPRSTVHSSQLKKITIRDGSIVRTDYVDENGEIAIAADLGYATIVANKSEYSLLEQYYDDKGAPISRNDGYYAVLREYDERGNNIRNTYLDIQGNPVITRSGYAVQEREYNSHDQLIAIRYYDTKGYPISTVSNGYGRIYEYDENGNAFRITYIDISGAPMMTKQGFAIVVRNYYASENMENREVESEFYFDENGNPVSLSLGQLGVHKEYDENGRESVLTYLDSEGNPIVTTKGYTTVLRTFHANNSVATERYFDIAGNPFSLSEGQYGIKIENGRTTYLNENGVEYFNLKTLLYNQSWLVVFFGMAFVLLSVFLEKRLNLLILFMYLIVITYMTLMFRESGRGKVRFELFYSYRDIFTNSGTRADIFKNIWLFIPLGAILYRLYPKKIVLLVPAAISILIEVIQYITGTGICEFDDVISNGLGGIIGYQTSKLLVDLKQYYVLSKHCTIKKECTKNY